MARRHGVLFLGGLVLTGGCIFGQTWKAWNGGLPKEAMGVTQVVVSADATVAYAVNSTGGLLRRSGSTGRWKQLDGVLGVTALAIAPSDSSVVYAASNTGLHESSDRGATWKSVKSGIASENGIGFIAVDLADAAIAYAVIPSQILKTTDAGGTWTQAASFNNATPVVTIALDPSAASTLYATTLFGGILKSVDGGRTWASIKAPLQNTGFSSTSATLTIDPRNSSILYAGSYAAFTDPGFPQPGLGTVSKSSDGGQTWTVFRTGIPAGVFVGTPVIDPANSQVLYAALEQDNAAGVLKSTDGGQTWSQVYASSGTGISLSAASGVVYAANHASLGGAGGIVASIDGGRNWATDNQGLLSFNLGTLVLDPADPGVIYTGGGAGLFRKSNGFDFTSVQVPAPSGNGQPVFSEGAPGVVSLAIDPANPQVLYVNTSSPNGCAYYLQALFKSTDGGKTWDSGVSPLDSGCVLLNSLLLIDPHNPQTVYAVENDYVDGGYTLIKSVDGGSTWNNLWSNSSQVSVLVADASHAGTLYAALVDLFSSGDPSGLFKSIDGGITWTETGLAKVNVTVLAIAPTDSNTLFAGSAHSVYKSSDGGATWVPLSQGLSQLAESGAVITSLAIDPGNPATVYASTSGAGIYITSDGGNHWVGFNEGLTTMDVQSVATSPLDPSSVYTLTAHGVFKLTKP